MTCPECLQLVPTGQRLWPATRWDPAIHRYIPKRLCLRCLTKNDPRPKFIPPARTLYRLQGSMVPTAKLNESLVRQMRQLKGTMSQRQIAARFQVNISTVNGILSGRKWNHVL